MNLRLIHAVVILFSAALAALFGLWSLGLLGRTDGVTSLPLAVAAFAVAIGLVVYDSWFLRKTKSLRVASMPSEHRATSDHASDSGHDPADIDRHVMVYITVFVALMALTLITVAVSYLDLDTPRAIAVALVIATIKGSLVAGYFMHLVSEKKLIYAVLVLTVAFFVALLALPLLTHSEGFWIPE